MKPEDIHIGDWMRILVGEVPASFLLELVIRAIVIYLILMVSMRSMGKRMSSQLSRNELAALVSLAAAIGVPMMAPDRGLLPAIVVAFVLIAIQRAIAKAAFKSESFEHLTQGRLAVLIKNAVIDVKKQEGIGLSQERLFAELRCQGIAQLGEVKRFYMEANGAFTLIKNEEEVNGLSVLPPVDKDFIAEFKQSGELACCFCGKIAENKKIKSCSNCGKNEWTTAVTSQ